MQLQSASLTHAPRFVAPNVGAAVPDDIKLIGVAKGFAADQEIFAEGDATDFVYKVVSGAVRTVRVLADGRRQVCEFHLPGDVFGFEFAAERRQTAEAVSEAVVIVARRSSLAGDPDIDARLWRLAARDLARSQDHVLTLGRRSAAERVASFLLDLSQRLGTHDEIDLPMSRQDMADYLGLTIETVSRTFSQLQASGLIEVRCCRHVRLARSSALADLCE